MKIKSDFMLREIAGQWVVIPLGARVVEFNNIITLSETGAFIWKLLEKGATEEEIINALTAEYEVEQTQVENDVKVFIQNILDKDLCE